MLERVPASFVLPGGRGGQLRRVWAQGGEDGVGMAPASLIKGYC